MSESGPSIAGDCLVSVLHVVAYYPPDRIGGVGEHVRLIHEGTTALGIRSEILTSGDSRSDPLVHRVGRSPTGFFFNVWRRAKLAREFDVLHVHHGEGLLFLLVGRCLRDRPRILMMYHVDVRRREAAARAHVVADRTYGPSGFRGAIRRFAGLGKAAVDRIAWTMADRVVVETDHVREELLDLRPPREVTVIRHGLARSTSEGQTPARVELLYVGTAGTRKRTHLLPMILRKVREVVSSARLRVVGFGVDDDPPLREDAERLEVLDSIEFVGRLPTEDVVPFYRAADVLVLPSAYEGLPMVLLEAMREGLVPVATDVSGHPDAITDGTSGYLVPVDDVDRMAERCVRLLKDPASAAQMGERAREVVAHRFILDEELQSYAELYRRLQRTPSD